MRFAENKEFNNVFQPTINDLSEGFKNKGNWNKSFFNNQSDITLELGCGKGEYTIGLSSLYPQKNYIGIDIKGARLWRGAKTAIEKDYKNVAFVRTHIGNLAKVFAPNEIAELWIPFPDPQMKKTRKRLTGSFFLNQYQHFLKPNGHIHIKTDSNFLYKYTKVLLEHNNIHLLADIDDIYVQDEVIPVLQIQTFYEQQFLARSIPSKYLCFKLPHKEIKEPDIEIPKDEYRSFGRR